MSSEPQIITEDSDQPDDADPAAGADDLSIVPACTDDAGATRPPRRVNRRSTAALLLSLTVHAAAGAALAAYSVHVLSSGPPSLVIDAGAGEGTPSVSLAAGTAQPDGASDLLAGVDQPADIPPLVVDEPTRPPDDHYFEDSSSGASEAFDPDNHSTAAEPAADPAWIGLGSPGATPTPSARQSPPIPASAAITGGSDGLAGPGDSASLSGDGAAAGSPAPHASNRPPRYPREALRRRWQGTVVLEVDVSVGGEVDDAHVLQSSGYEVLDRAALEAVLAWRFTSSTGGPLAVAWKGTLPVEFVLRR